MMVVGMVLLAPVGTMAQNDARFHIELDYSYHLGVYEKLHNYDYHQSSGLEGHALTLNALYNIRPDMTVGVGFGLSRYCGSNSMNVNTAPLYAIFRYRPLAAHRGFYTYLDAGSTLFNNAEDTQFMGGFVGSIGAGYQWMLKRHFGLNFRLGYNLQQIDHVPTAIGFKTPPSDAPLSSSPDLIYAYPSLWRHSLQFSLGLVF